MCRRQAPGGDQDVGDCRERRSAEMNLQTATRKGSGRESTRRAQPDVERGWSGQVRVRVRVECGRRSARRLPERDHVDCDTDASCGRTNQRTPLFPTAIAEVFRTRRRSLQRRPSPPPPAFCSLLCYDHSLPDALSRTALNLDGLPRLQQVSLSAH